MVNAKSDVLTACPGAEARWGSGPDAGWTIRWPDADGRTLGVGKTEAEAWSDALQRLIEESVMRR